jgi:undecaprenyl-diphosphatase
LLVGRLFYIQYGPLDLAPDEAHYWEWSRRLDLSYYSKGPVIAYLIALTTRIGGDNVFSVRVLSPFLLSLGSFFIYKLSKDMFGNEKIGILSGLVLQITLLFAAYGILMTIDSPFLFFWCLALWLFWKAVSDKRVDYWYYTGIIIGLGFLAKYIMAFFYISALLYLIFSKEDRYWLKNIHPYLAVILSIIVISPVIIWNASHDWVTLLHTAGHINIHDGFRIEFKDFFEFVGSQIGLLNPFVSGLIIYFLLLDIKTSSKWPREKKYLLFFSMTVLIFFLMKSIQGKVQANWAMVSYPAIFVLFSYHIITGWKNFTMKLKSLIVFSLAFSVLLSSLSHFPSALHLPPNIDPSTRLKGWNSLGKEIGSIYDSLSKQGHVFVFSDSYQISSELAFYIRSHPITYCVNLGRRMNQYDFWTDMNSEAKKIRQNRKQNYRNIINGIFVTIGDREIPREIAESFDKYEKRMFKVYDNSSFLREYSIFIGYNFKRIETEKPGTY